MHLQTSAKKTIQDTAETTVDLVEKKNSEKITEAASKYHLWGPKQIACADYERPIQPVCIPKEKYISPERCQKIIDGLLLSQSQIHTARMVYQKIVNLFHKTKSQPSKFRKNNWVKVNHDAHGTCNTNSQN